MGLILIFVVITALLAIGGAATAKLGDRLGAGMIGLLIGLGGSVFLIGAIGGGISLATVSGAVQDEAFFFENAAVYAQATTRLHEGVPVHVAEGQTPGPLFFESANLKQIANYATAVNTERAELVAFNKHVRFMRRWERSFLVGVFFVNLDPAVTPLGLEVLR